MDHIDYCKVLADMEDKNAGRFLAAIDVANMDTKKILCQHQQQQQKHEENYLKLVDMIGKLQTDAPIIGDKICDAYTDMLSCPNLDI